MQRTNTHILLSVFPFFFCTMTLGTSSQILANMFQMRIVDNDPNMLCQWNHFNGKLITGECRYRDTIADAIFMKFYAVREFIFISACSSCCSFHRNSVERASTLCHHKFMTIMQITDGINTKFLWKWHNAQRKSLGLTIEVALMNSLWIDELLGDAGSLASFPFDLIQAFEFIQNYRFYSIKHLLMTLLRLRSLT